MVGGANLVIPKQSWIASRFCMEEFKIWPCPFDTSANGITRVCWLKTTHYLVYIFLMCVANAFESSSTELFLGLSMQKPGLIGGLRMFELVSENAEVDHNIYYYLSETSKRACSQAFRGCPYWLPHDQSIPIVKSPPKITRGEWSCREQLAIKESHPVSEALMDDQMEVYGSWL